MRGHGLLTRHSVISVLCPVLRFCGAFVKIMIDWSEEKRKERSILPVQKPFIWRNQLSLPFSSFVILHNTFDLFTE